MIETIRSITKSWIKPRTTEERLYLDQEKAAAFIGLDIRRYKSGSIKSATLEGETISNSTADRIIHSMARAYFDVTTRQWYAAFGDLAISLIIEKIEAEATEATEAEATEAEATEAEATEAEATEAEAGISRTRRAVMLLAHAIRREAAARFSCPVGEILFSACLRDAWAKVKAASRPSMATGITPAPAMKTRRRAPTFVPLASDRRRDGQGCPRS